MPRRPLLAAAATLSTLTLLTACNGSPEAGRPNTTPSTSATTSSPTPIAPSTPTWTAEEQAALTAAKARYTAARAAVAIALNAPENADRSQLEATGNGGAWLTQIVQRIVYLRDRNLYQSGDPVLTSIAPAAVDLSAAQPAVTLKACLDGSKTQMRYRKTDKPVPVVTVAGGTRHVINARLIYAPAKTGSKMWFLVDEKVLGKC